MIAGSDAGVSLFDSVDFRSDVMWCHVISCDMSKSVHNETVS